jgi:hypothetical protein
MYTIVHIPLSMYVFSFVGKDICPALVLCLPLAKQM